MVRTLFEFYFHAKRKLNGRFVYDYITQDEYRCSHCSKLPDLITIEHLTDWGEDALHAAILWLDAVDYIFRAFADLRSWYDKPIIITSGYRCPEHQLHLYESGKSRAKISAHNFGVALDIMPPSNSGPGEVKILYDYLDKHYPDLRLGFQSYSMRFIHMDSAFLLPLGFFRRMGIIKDSDYNHLSKYYHQGARW